jgi:hypothetical protein
MIIKYKIVEVWPNDHLIVVRYYTDKISEQSLASFPDMKPDGTPVRCRTDVSISIPIPEPSADELEKLILRNAPIFALETFEAVSDPSIDTSLSVAASLLGVEISKTKEDYQKLFENPNKDLSLSEEELISLLSNTETSNVG